MSHALHTVHLDEQLIKGVFTFIVAAAKRPSLGARSSHRIDLIDKDDARCVLSRFSKEITNL